jgi:hypothetical protein
LAKVYPLDLLVVKQRPLLKALLLDSPLLHRNKCRSSGIIAGRESKL